MQAQVEKEQATAAKLRAEAEKAKAEAERAWAESRKIDFETKLKGLKEYQAMLSKESVSRDCQNSSQISSLLEEIEADIRELKIVYGGDIAVENPNLPSQSDDSLEAQPGSGGNV